MNLVLSLRRRAQWLNVPTLSLLALLQRSPAMQLLSNAAEYVASSPVGAVLRSAATIAALGALHSRAGATELAASSPSPLQAKVGTPIPTVAFGLIGTQTPASSWQIGGDLPPGLEINGSTRTGAFNVSTPQLEGTPTAPGTYELTLSGSDQGFVSPMFSYVIVVAAGAGATAPAFTQQPQNQTVTAGANVTFTANASGSPAPTYQWRKDGAAINGATNSSLTLTTVTAANAGTYTVVATNSAGSATSSNAVLTVNAAGVAAPTITVQPVSQTVAPGGSVTFSVTATGTSPAYQWFKDGAAVAGATASTLSLDNLSGANSGDYTVRITTAGGSVTSRLTRLTVEVPDPGRISNLSVRAPAGVGGQSLTVGFIVSGGSKPLLIRAAGPALAAFNVPGTLPDPTVQVHQKINGVDTVVATNNDWSADPANAAAVSAIPGPFPFANGSKDAAFILNVDSDRTALVSDTSNAVGVTLVEVYDVGTGNSPRLVNVSTLNFAGTDDNVLIAGFIISGNVPKTLLIRGVGPTLSDFGVGGLLADPVMEIHTRINNVDTVIASNDDWSTDPNATAAAAIPGPFPLKPNSKDAALLITLPAGAYTVQVSGVNRTTGNTLIEVYDLQ
jgi:hypothetical protein